MNSNITFEISDHISSIKMDIHGTFTYGLPGETREQMQDTKNYISEELENKIRIERKRFWNRVKFTTGFNLDISRHKIDNEETIYDSQSNSLDSIDFKSDIRIPRFGGYTQASTSFFDSRFIVSFGLRTDAAILSPDSDFFKFFGKTGAIKNKKQ